MGEYWAGLRGDVTYLDLVCPPSGYFSVPYHMLPLLSPLLYLTAFPMIRPRKEMDERMKPVLRLGVLPSRTYQNVMQRKEEGTRRKHSTRHILRHIHRLGIPFLLLCGLVMRCLWFVVCCLCWCLVVWLLLLVCFGIHTFSRASSVSPAPMYM